MLDIVINYLKSKLWEVRELTKKGDGKEEYIGTRVPQELKDAIIERFIESRQYRDMSDFIRSLIDKEMENPVGPNDRLKRQLLSLLDDPDVAKKIQRK
jgi:Arc/MetJ-type ribon-helix-helix transcriptional regulator